MTRRLELTAAKWAAVQAGGWLVMPGDVCPDRRHYIVGDIRRRDVHDDVRCPQRCFNADDGQRRLNGPPAALVAVAAPCETCGGSRIDRRLYFGDDRSASTWLCPDCRITLLGECPHDCKRFGGKVPGHLRGSNWDWVPCWCNGTGTVPLGHAYAVGEVQQVWRYGAPTTGTSWLWLCTALGMSEDAVRALVGQYALRLEVLP